VLLKAPHPAAGKAALYSTTFTPVVTCNLTGFVNPGQAPGVDADSAEGSGSEREGTALQAGTGLLQAVFAPVAGKPEAAALLSVGQKSSNGELSRVVNVPIYF
jgi:hypothetical protein